MEQKPSVESLSTKKHRDVCLEDREVLDNISQDHVDFPRDIHGWGWILVVGSLLCLSFLFGFNATVTAGSQARIVQDFEAVEKLAWNSVAFFLGAAITILSWGQVYGQFNPKQALISSMVLFGIGNIVSGAGPGIDALIVGRTISGIGGSGMYVGASTLLSITTTETECSMYTSLSTLAWGIGIILGPMIGGALTGSRAGWRWGFYINLCIGAIFAPIFVLLVPAKDPRPTTHWRERLANIDGAGLALLTGSMTFFLLAINLGGSTFAWSSASIIVLWIVAIILIALFGLQQMFGWLAHDVLFPVEVVRSFRLLTLFIHQACSATSCFVPCYFIPLYMQYVRNDNPLMAAVHLLPFLSAVVFTMTISEQVIRKLGRWAPWLFYGGIFTIFGAALMYTVDDQTSTAKIYGYSILLGTGAGAYLQLPNQTIANCVNEVQRPAAIGLITWAQVLAPGISLSIAHTVFLNSAKRSIARLLSSDVLIDSLDLVSGIGIQALDVRSRHEVVRIVAGCLAKSYVLVITSGGLTFVLSFILLWHMCSAATRNN